MILNTDKRGRKRKFTDKAKPLFRQLYIDEEISSHKMGKLLGLTGVSVINYLRRFNIPVRTTSEAKKGSVVSEETKRKISDTMRGVKKSEETREKMLKAKLNMSDETRRKISEGNKGKRKSEETKRKQSAALQGCSLDEWNGYTSFEPYCPKFNYEKKEEIRNRDNRVCQLCGKSELLEGRKLSVHHIDSDKMQGCNGKQWGLVALCRSCNSKTDTAEKEFLIVSNLNK